MVQSPHQRHCPRRRIPNTLRRCSASRHTPNRSLYISERVISRAVDVDCEQVVDPFAPGVRCDDIAVFIQVSNHLPVVVVDVTCRALKRRRQDAPTERVVFVAFCEHAVGRNRNKLILAVPRQVERGPSVTLDARDVAREVVCVGNVAIGCEPVKVVVGVVLLGLLGHLGRIAERVSARDDASCGVVLVFEAADCRAACRAP